MAMRLKEEENFSRYLPHKRTRIGEAQVLFGYVLDYLFRRKKLPEIRVT
jgi:hypothetical protein